MKLVIFDIDGTVTDSVKVDDECFIQVFHELLGINLNGVDWNTFQHVTDSGITSEIFNIYLNRSPSKEEIFDIKSYFYELLHKRRAEIYEIKGAIEALKLLSHHPEFAIAFATGGWRETALLKLSAIGFELQYSTLTSSNEHSNRSEIVKLTIAKSLIENNQNEFDSITYIGDGIWDFIAAKQLEINFIGVDYVQNAKLTSAGAPHVLPDLANVDQIIDWI